MSLLPKISRLSKIPELLKHRREEEEHQQEQKRRQKQQKERNSKFIVDEVTISQSSKAHLEVEKPNKMPEMSEINKDKEDGIGIKIDLKV